MTPLAVWYGAGFESPGTGMPVAAQERQDFDNPLDGLRFDSRLELHGLKELDFEDRHTTSRAALRRVSGNQVWRDTGSGRYAGSFLIDSSDWALSTVDDGTYHATQRNRSATFGIAAQPAWWWAAGIGVDVTRDASAGSASVALAPDPHAAFTLRSRERRRSIPLSYTAPEGRLDVALDSRQRTNFFGVRLRGGSALEASSEFDVSDPLNLRTEITWRHAVLRLRAHHVREHADYAGDVQLDGAWAGRINGETRGERFGFDVALASENGVVYAGMQRSLHGMRLAGNVSDEGVIDLWAYLLPGERRFIADYRFDFTQWFVATERRLSDRWGLSGGLQYAEAEVRGAFEHWTPIPLLGIGKLDAQLKPYAVTDARAVVIAGGVSYRSGALEVRYGVAQIIPVDAARGSAQETSADSGAPPGDSGGGPGTTPAAPTGKDERGGMLHAVSVVWWLE